MGLNIALNAIIGAIPVFGDIFSIWFRSNAKNATLLERSVRPESRRTSTGDWLFVTGIIAGFLLLLALIVIAVAWLLKQLWNSL
jgi:hypothetical protein